MEGQQSTPLSHLGQQQAQHLSNALLPLQAIHQANLSNPALSNPLKLTKTRPTHLYSSPLLRATQTAQALQKALKKANLSLPIKQHQNLQEIHPGIFQGLTWAEATTQYPSLCEHLMTSSEWRPVPEAESLTEARSRAQAWVDKLLSQHHPGETVWAVSHAGLMLHIIAAIMGCDRTWKINISHTAIFEFWLANTSHRQTHPNLGNDLGENKFNPEYWILRRFNDTSHLQGLSQK